MSSSRRVRRAVPGLRPLVCACLLLMTPAAARAQAQTADPVDLILRTMEDALNAGDRAAFASLFAIAQPRIDGYVADLFIPGARRTVVRERDRAPLEGAPAGDGYRLVIEIFVETAGRARILTAGMDVRRPPGGDVMSWRIVNAEGMTSIEGIFKLRLNTTTQYAASHLEIAAEDLVLTLTDGTVFLVECDEGVTGVVLVGRGEVRFSPAPAMEQGQLRIFSGDDTLTTSFDGAFVRLNPRDYQKAVTTAALTAVPIDPRQLRRAQEVFARESPKSFSIDLRDFSRETWHLLPPGGDFLAEVNTRRYDTLTYSRSNAQAEDITLFQREHKRTIALYSSRAKIAARGRFYSEDSLREYDVIDYNIEASVVPNRQYIQGRARLSIRTRASLSTITLRLADSLVVTGVTTVEYGRLLNLRIRNQNTVLVNLPRMLQSDSDLTMIVTYAGRVESQLLETESIGADQDPAGPPAPALEGPMRLEPNFLLSNRSFWYPQNPVPDYATATLRLTVPKDYTAVASGEPQPPTSVVSLRDIAALPEGSQVFSFRANEPLRYLSFVVSRFTRVTERTFTAGPAAGTDAAQVLLRVEANPRQRARARTISPIAEDILRFYTSLLNDAPFPSITVALVDSDLPGGHSPGYFAVVNEPLPTTNNLSWKSDPASFDDFPEFFLAHELAHQWWGQAIGWKNYHEQWLSEGFAQYFAALYAQKARGDRTFVDMLRQFRRWTLAESDQGPVHLGYRLGHIKNDFRIYRALVYNKGAGVLHMLRRLVGDEAFFKGLQRFYEDRKFQKAGTDDLQRAFEAEVGRPLDRFFERWIYGTELPRVKVTTSIADRQARVRLEQRNDVVFDLPVTVTLAYADGRSKDVLVVMTDTVLEQTLVGDAPIRQVQINRDSAALAEFDER